MGTLLRTYENMFHYPEEFYPEPDSDRLHELSSELLKFLKNFSQKYRNPAGHLDIDSKRTYEGASLEFQKFLDKYIKQLYEIKSELNGSEALLF